MKVIKTSLVAMALACALNASAQDKTNLVKAGNNLLIVLHGNDGAHLYGGISAALEHPLNNKTTLVFGVNLNTKEEFSNKNGGLLGRFTVLTFEPEIRWYPKTATDGFYVGIGPSVLVQKRKIFGANSFTERYANLGAGLKMGYQLLLTRGLMLQFGTGMNLVFESWIAEAGVLTSLNAMLGYQF